MPRVDTHAVARHCVLDLIDDGPTCGLDSQHLCGLDDMIGGRVFANDTYDAVSESTQRKYEAGSDLAWS